MECLLCARHCVKCFITIVLFNCKLVACRPSGPVDGNTVAQIQTCMGLEGIWALWFSTAHAIPELFTPLLH